MKRFNAIDTVESESGAFVTWDDHAQALFTARRELYRLTKAHAVELQRLRDRIAQLEEQKRQACIALGFEDPDKVRT